MVMVQTLIGLRPTKIWLEYHTFKVVEKEEKQQMADLEQRTIPKETAMQALNTIIQLHFDKTMEKKQAVDKQKKQLFTYLHHFFIFLALLLLPLVFGSSHTGGHGLQCKHVWIPLGILSMSHLAFYVSVAQTLRCINRFKYQRRCHKLTLGLATERLRQLQAREESDINTTTGDNGRAVVELEIAYQEPPQSYMWKFKRNWGLYFAFLFVCYILMIVCSFVLLCG